MLAKLIDCEIQLLSTLNDFLKGICLHHRTQKDTIFFPTDTKGRHFTQCPVQTQSA
jgi:hypothetical protein